jgi:ubiquinone biosynthesis monooxygenase Coq7
MDRFIATFDIALRTLLATPKYSSSLPSLSKTESNSTLTIREKELSASLMRVNHVGEVCAQALYAAQSLATSDHKLKQEFLTAAKDELNHLAWTASRIEDLQSRTSLLNPFWFAGAFTMGYLIAKLGGNRVSLGFLEETEKQVCEHLQSHLNLLPEKDVLSREMVKQMINDEYRHANRANDLGSTHLAPSLKIAMRVCAKVMTSISHYV